MKDLDMITHKYVLHRYTYNPLTGSIIHNYSTGNAVKGAEIGYDQGSGKITTIYSTRVLIHRLIFFYMEGRWPTIIDHIDRNHLNNRWDNLREVTSSQNSYNRGVSSGNLSCGIKGIHYRTENGYKKPWGARIKAEGKAYRKSFATLAEALQWLSVQRTLLHGEYATPANQSKPST